MCKQRRKEKEKEEKRKTKKKLFSLSDKKNTTHRGIQGGSLVDQNRVYPPFALMTAASLSGIDAKRFLQYSFGWRSTRPPPLSRVCFQLPRAPLC